MEKGEIGWAGGSSGPDFFIYLGAQPAEHWKHDHTVWGEVADEASIRVAERIAAQPYVADESNFGMKMMVNRLPLVVTVEEK